MLSCERTGPRVENSFRECFFALRRFLLGASCLGCRAAAEMGRERKRRMRREAVVDATVRWRMAESDVRDMGVEMKCVENGNSVELKWIVREGTLTYSLHSQR